MGGRPTRRATDSREAVAAAARVHQLDSVADLRQRSDAEEDLILVDLVQPSGDVGVGRRLHPLRDDVGVEKEAYRSMSRGPSWGRSISRPDSRKGETAKKSVSVP